MRRASRTTEIRGSPSSGQRVHRPRAPPRPEAASRTRSPACSPEVDLGHQTVRDAEARPPSARRARLSPSPTTRSTTHVTVLAALEGDAAGARATPSRRSMTSLASAVMSGRRMPSGSSTATRTSKVTIPLSSIDPAGAMRSTLPVEHSAAEGVDGDESRHALADPAQVDLVDARLDVHAREVAERHDLRGVAAGGQNRGDAVADLLVAHEHDAVDRTADRRLAQRGLAALELGLRSRGQPAPRDFGHRGLEDRQDWPHLRRLGSARRRARCAASSYSRSWETSPFACRSWRRRSALALEERPARVLRVRTLASSMTRACAASTRAWAPSEVRLVLRELGLELLAVELGQNLALLSNDSRPPRRAAP